MNRPPADVFGQALLEDPPQWAELHVVANRREYRESLGLEVGPWEPARRPIKTATLDRLRGQDKANWRSRTRR
jgi:hypothetical protein